MTERLRPNDRERAVFIVNPYSGGGATARRLDALRRAVDRYFTSAEIRTTEGPGHGTTLAADAVAEGADAVFAVGGDGTANEVANGLFDGTRPRAPGTVFGVVPAGTGSDFVRSLKMPADLDAAVRIAAFGPVRACDVVHATFRDHRGGEGSRIGINVTGFGINGDVVKRANRSSKRLGGTLTFAGATVASLVRFSPVPLAVSWEDLDGAHREYEGPLLAAFLANGAYCGGGMWVGRGGRMDDGAVDVVLIPKMGPARLAWHASRLYTGRLDAVPGVVRSRARTLRASPAAPSPDIDIDIDGEHPGTLPLTIVVLAKSLQIRGVWA